MTNYVSQEIDYFIIFLRSSEKYFFSIFQNSLKNAAPFLVVTVELLIIAYFAREALKFFAKV